MIVASRLSPVRTQLREVPVAGLSCELRAGTARIEGFARAVPEKAYPGGFGSSRAANSDARLSRDSHPSKPTPGLLGAPGNRHAQILPCAGQKPACSG